MTAPVVQISGNPTDEEAVAIAAAVELAWPRPVVVVAAPSGPSPASSWRWSGRWWTHTRRPAADRRRP